MHKLLQALHMAGKTKTVRYNAQQDRFVEEIKDNESASKVENFVKNILDLGKGK